MLTTVGFSGSCAQRFFYDDVGHVDPSADLSGHHRSALQLRAKVCVAWPVANCPTTCSRAASLGLPLGSWPRSFDQLYRVAVRSSCCSGGWSEADPAVESALRFCRAVGLVLVMPLGCARPSWQPASSSSSPPPSSPALKLLRPGKKGPCEIHVASRRDADRLVARSPP